MSHYTVLVITPNGTEQEAEELLAPYDEQIEVEPYDKQCYCVGLAAKRLVRERIELEMPIEKARAEFNAREDVKKLIEQSTNDGNYGFSDEADKLWETLYGRPYELREAELFALEPTANSPDPECETCNGTGIENTTYNPRSKWDWYSLGGRWSDVFGELQGQPVSKLAEAVNEDGSPLRTFAVLTPDGRWLEKGRMLYFAVVADKKDPQEWEACYNGVLEQYKDHKALYYDCHI